jgi:hypothetical protein
MQKRNGDNESSCNIPLFVLTDLDSIYHLFVFNQSCILHFHNDNFYSLIVSLFTHASSKDFSKSQCETLSNAFW